MDPNGGDTRPGPCADAGEDRVINISVDQEMATVQLDAGASQAGPAVPMTYDWYEGDVFLGRGAAGRHVCTLVVTDAEGQQDGTDVVVYVN